MLKVTPSTSGAVVTNHTVLMIEDNPDNAQLAKWILEDEGYNVESAVTAEDGLAMLAQKSYDVVLMDISLPGMSGKDAIKEIRANDQLKAIPVIAVTAHAVLNERDDILASGADYLVTKPIQEEVFLDAITKCLNGDFPTR